MIRIASAADAHTEVAELHRAIARQHHVAWLNICVHDLRAAVVIS
jgi:hypothetical protein